MTVTNDQGVSGQQRFKYFKRPIMPRVNAVPPQVLLSTTTAAVNPLIPEEKVVEPTSKDAQIQTVYRESESQTTPYTPNYVVEEGTDPELLLLKNLTYENGLPLGKREIEMIEQARKKRELENNMPPFTDEASLRLRKKLMEQQEMLEFKIRESEMDSKRDQKLVDLEQAIMDREESNEFLISQRIEGVRLLRMEEREKILQKIKNKRIKALRRLAHQRNISDPILSDGIGNDIINDYFDRGSAVYAPVKRVGKNPAPRPDMFDVSSRTVPLDNVGNILSLEYTIPKRLMDNPVSAQMSKSMPVGAGINMRGNGVADQRLTSAAQRALRQTKRDVEEMHRILQKKKREPTLLNTAHLQKQRGDEDDQESGNLTPSSNGKLSRANSTGPNGSLMTKKPKGRPRTPDYTADSAHPTGSEDFQSAIMLLQRLVRGRAVQNIMFEGKLRRKELILELQRADVALAAKNKRDKEREADSMLLHREQKTKREAAVKESTLDAVAGIISSNILSNQSQEKDRVECVHLMQSLAHQAVNERRLREAAESGRRQREGLNYPVKH